MALFYTKEHVLLIAIFLLSTLVYLWTYSKVMSHGKYRIAEKRKEVRKFLWQGHIMILKNPQAYLDDEGVRLLQKYRKWWYVLYAIWILVIIGLYLLEAKYGVNV